MIAVGLVKVWQNGDEESECVHETDESESE